MRSRPGGALAAVLLVGAGLAGCSSGTEAYCETVTEQATELQRLSEDAESPADALSVLETLREQAPEDLSDEWDTFVFAWRDLSDAVAAAPTPGEDDAVTRAAEELLSPRVAESARGIEQHALDVCKVDLSTSGLDF